MHGMEWPLVLSREVKAWLDGLDDEAFGRVACYLDLLCEGDGRLPRRWEAARARAALRNRRQQRPRRPPGTGVGRVGRVERSQHESAQAQADGRAVGADPR
jgi:hypothetical protein